MINEITRDLNSLFKETLDSTSREVHQGDLAEMIEMNRNENIVMLKVYPGIDWSIEDMEERGIVEFSSEGDGTIISRISGMELISSSRGHNLSSEELDIFLRLIRNAKNRILGSEVWLVV